MGKTCLPRAGIQVDSAYGFYFILDCCRRSCVLWVPGALCRCLSPLAGAA